MIYPQIDHLKWAEMYDLNTEPLPCECCGLLLERTIPYAHGEIRGLKSQPHGCPEKYDHSSFKTLNKGEQYELRSLLSTFSPT